MTWSHFVHDADLGLRGSGPTKAAAFEAIATALTAAVTDPERVEATECIDVHCEAPSDDMLLLDWLNALIYEMAVRKMLFSRFHVTLRDGELQATVTGEAVDRRKHRPAVEVKGATFTALALERVGADWVAECVVDV